jgi:hypothetical protein
MNRWGAAAASVVVMAGLGSFNVWSVFRRPLSELYGANVNTALFPEQGHSLLPIDAPTGYLSHSAAMDAMNQCELWGVGAQLITI